ncbi:lipid-A-disaccharide synthase [Chitinasiproducens palmae]|uniref:Lipid-A-disaccharide synthase n=1 Tax=Chitinasiproducens palmae TaxID=1770053 RepID=A0A1H2PLT2_9BURK|nr:lipid-A-disaccharide synthase [Chitinasiproducens palmae]SDV47462.1 lipid-A-disaccharide synthase [Chitinasiproducens palmae]
MPNAVLTRARAPAGTVPDGPPRLAMVAGEASGDLLGAALLGGLRTRLPAAEIAGIGGPRMVAAGFDARWPSETLAVNGYVEVLRHVPAILALRRQLVRWLLTDPPDAFVGIDAPDFNFGVEKALRAAGVPTVHFVSPSIWAWRGGRIKTIARASDHMLCLFPFEKDIYDRAGIAATFVGHPLADAIPMVPDTAGARRRLGIAETGPCIGVMPGSRQGEIHRIAPVFLEAMALMQQREPGLRFLLAAANETAASLLAPLIATHPQLSVHVIVGDSHGVLEASDAMLIKSGTSTLEAALFKKPMVISYKVPWLTGQIMRRQGYLPYVGLPNILAGRFVVPELLQHFATPSALADATLAQLNDEVNRRELTAIFTEIHQSLRQGTAHRAADAVAEVVETARGRRGQAR